MGKITVIGSINMDLVVKTNEIPKLGETLLGEELLQIPGGKGANQAAAIGKLGGKVAFLGKLGNDNFSKVLLKELEEAGVDTSYIENEDISSGLAVINVDKEGNNNIVVIPGANGLVDDSYLARHESVFKESEILVFQHEIPLETVKYGLKLGKELGKITILNPAPAMDLDDETIENIDILIPNEHELGRMAKMEISDDKSILDASKILLEKGIEKIIVTLGSRGALYIDSNTNKFFDAYKVDVVDTTGAGDSFIGGFTASYQEDRDIERAIDMGQKTAALAIQKIGAQSSLPSRKDVENFNQGV